MTTKKPTTEETLPDYFTDDDVVSWESASPEELKDFEKKIVEGYINAFNKAHKTELETLEEIRDYQDEHKYRTRPKDEINLLVETDGDRFPFITDKKNSHALQFWKDIKVPRLVNFTKEGKKLFESVDAESRDDAFLMELTDKGLKEIDKKKLDLLHGFFGMIYEATKDEVKEGIVNNTFAARQIYTVFSLYAPDFAAERQKTQNLSERDIQEDLEFFRSFDTVFGVIPTKSGKPSIFKALSFQAYDHERNIYIFTAPYLMKLVQKVIFDSIKKDKNGYFKRSSRSGKLLTSPSVTYLLKKSLLKRRDTAAIINVELLVQQVVKAGDPKKGEVSILVRKKTRDLISENEYFRQRLENAKSDDVKRGILRRIMSDTYDYLVKDTWLFETYDSFCITSSVPTLKELPTHVVIISHGYEKKK